MKRLAAIALLLLSAAVPARAASIPFVGPGFDPTNQAVNFNNLIQQINLIIVPLLPTVPNGTNGVSLVNATTGNPPVIQPGGPSVDSNASLGLTPLGTNALPTSTLGNLAPNAAGNIIFFPANAGFRSGVIQVANSASWFPAKGLSACPGSFNPGGQPAGFNLDNGFTGPGNVVNEFLVIKDWLGRTRFVPAC